MVANVAFGELNLLEQFFYDLWIVFGNVGCFADVRFQVIERRFGNVSPVFLRDVLLPRLAFFCSIKF